MNGCVGESVAKLMGSCKFFLVSWECVDEMRVYLLFLLETGSCSEC